jgi:hypothetical protein
MALVALLLYQMTTPFPRSPLIFFSVAAFWIYLLAILSIGRLSAMLHPTVWWLLRSVGVEYISYAFISDFAKNPFHGGFVNLLAYLPFITVAVAGPVLRLAAWAKRLSHSRRLAVYSSGAGGAIKNS